MPNHRAKTPDEEKTVTELAAIYARYSSDLQSVASIEDQVRLCRAHAERQGWQVVDVYCDAAYSGALKDRPGLDAMLAALKTRSFQIVLTESLDRLSRDMEHLPRLYKVVEFHRARIVTLADPVVGDMQIGLKGLMGAMFLRDLAQKTHRGLEGRVRKGRGTGSVPYGYKTVRTVDEHGDFERGIREADPATSRVVQQIFGDYDAGISPRSIARGLNASGVPSPSGGTWFDSTIRGRPDTGEGILRNATYVGRIVWNRRGSQKDPATGRRVRRPNAKEAIIVVDAPELQIISREMWDRVQQRMYQNAVHGRKERVATAGPPVASPVTDGEHLGLAPARSNFWDRRRPRHLLSGKAFCGQCGRAFTATGRDYLGCLVARNGACTNTRTIRRVQLEGYVLHSLLPQLMPQELVDLFVREFRDMWLTLVSDAASESSAKRRDVAVTERKIQKLVDAIADGGSSQSLRARLAMLEVDLERLDREIAELRPERITPVLPDDIAENYRAEVTRILADLSAQDATASREAARALIEKVILHPPVLDEGTLNIELVGDLRTILTVGGIRPATRRESASAADPLSVFTSSVKERQGARPLAGFGAAPRASFLSDRATGTQGRGQGAVVEDVEGAAHGHALADAGRGHAEGAEPVGQPVGRGGAVHGGAQSEDDLGDAACLETGQ